VDRGLATAFASPRRATDQNKPVEAGEPCQGRPPPPEGSGPVSPPRGLDKERTGSYILAQL